MPINWQKLFADKRLLSFTEKVVAKDVQSIVPSVSQNGDVFYPILDDMSMGDAIKLLDTFAAEGVFEKKSETRLLGCATHDGSLDLVARLKCPHCSGMLLKKGTMLQHNCGFIGNQEAFVANCSKCGKPSPAQTLKVMGTWYECEGCKQRFATPNVFLYCKKFDHDFPIQNAQLVDKASYRLTPEAVKDLKERLALIITLRQGIEAGGTGVEIFGNLLGASGVQHNFDLVVYRGETKIPVDVRFAKGAPLGVSDVLATYAKALDTKSKPSVLIAVPSASDDAKKSAVAYGMFLIEGSDVKAILAQFDQNLSNKSQALNVVG